MAFDVDVRVVGYDRVAKEFNRIVSPEELGNELGKQLVKALKMSPVWPVDTGFSKRNFGYRIVKNNVEITNRADYAIYVEERTGAVLRTLEDYSEQYTRPLDLYIESQWDKVE